MKIYGSYGLPTDAASSDAVTAYRDLEDEGRPQAAQRENSIWLRARDIVREQIGSEAFEKWVSSVTCAGESGGEIVLAAQSTIDRDRINRDYLRKIEIVWRQLDPEKRYLKISASSDLDADQRAIATANAESILSVVEAADADLESDAETAVIEDEMTGDDGYAQTFDTLMVGDSNRIAVGVAHKLAEDIAGPVSVILFYGGHGVGKTHLMRAVQYGKASRSGKGSVVYMSAEEFMLTFVEGVKNRDTSAQRKRIRQASIVLLDDLQLILSRKGTMKEFFSHLRFVTDHGGKVVLSADAAPTRLESLDNRMRDEIKGGVVVEIHRPDREERAAIVRSKVEIIQRDYPEFYLKEEWIDMIADRLPASGRALYGAVRNVFAGTALIDEPVTEAAVETAIRLQVGERRPPKMETVKEIVAKQYGLTKSDLECATRRQTLVRPRQFAMYLCRKLTTCSFPQIGGAFGRRDHTTVMYGYRKVKKLIETDKSVAEEVAELERMVMETPRNSDAA